MKITTDELASMNAKARKHPEVCELYLAHDYLDAYAMHTDLRVLQDGPQGAIGAVKDWERHGMLQFEFLKSEGLRRDMQVLEIGCGTGRLARKLVPWLDDDRYVGIDISVGAITAARGLAMAEGWIGRRPVFRTAIPIGVRADLVWAFSVFIHLPADVMTTVMRSVADALRTDGRFYFSYVPEVRDERTGLKQFRHTLATYQAAVAAAGLSWSVVPSWTGEQRIACARK